MLLRQMLHEAGEIPKHRRSGPALRAAEDAAEGTRGAVGAGEDAACRDVRFGEEGPAIADSCGRMDAEAGVKCSCGFGFGFGSESEGRSTVG